MASIVAIAPIGMFTGTAAAVTGTITEFRANGAIVQTSSSDPLGITSFGGQLWYTDAGENLNAPPLPSNAPVNQVGQMSADGTGFALHQVEPPGAVTVAIAPDGAGHLWIANNGSAANDVDEVNAQGGLMNTYGLDPGGVTGTATASTPTDITLGPDGQMWFTEFGSGRIGMVDPATNVLGTPLVVSGGRALGDTTTATSANPQAIASIGGKLWATVQNTQNIAIVTPPSGLVEDHVGLPNLAGITGGSDGNVWFTSEGGTTVNPAQADRPTMQGNGSLAMLPANAGASTAATTFTPPAGLSGGVFAPNAITSGPDGNLYMTDVALDGTGHNNIWQFNPVSHAWAKFQVPTPNAFSGNVQPTGITVGPDRNVWFTENNANIALATQQPAALARLEVDSTVSFSPAPLQFGTQAVNAAATKTINVSNSSPNPITVTGTTITGDTTDFTLGTNGCAASVPAGANSCTISVQFKPTTAGTKAATLVLSDGQGASGTDSVVLSGTGAGAPTFTPSSFTYPDVALGSSRSTVFSLSNGSGAALTVNAGGVTLGGTNPSDYRIVSDACSGITLGDGNSCAVNVAFGPTAVGTRTATLSVAYSGANSPQTATLSGRGVAPIPGTNPGGGYWLVASDGGIFTYGSATFHGSAGAIHLNKPIVGMARTPDGGGYWLVATDGGIFNYGDAGFYGSAGSINLNKPIVGMAATADGKGYWLVASDGGIFTYGDAKFAGSAGAIHLNKPIVGMAATPDGGGYWLVATDGGIFNYGDAGFHGSAGGINLNQPIAGMAPTATGGGYWLVATDGGIFTYGDAGFHGSAGAIHLNKPIVGMAPALDGGGYWLVATDGGIFNYGDAGFHGSAGSITLNKPIVGMTPAS